MFASICFRPWTEGARNLRRKITSQCCFNLHFTHIYNSFPEVLFFGWKQCYFNLHFMHRYYSFPEALFLGWKQCYLNLHFTHRYPSFPEVLFFGWKRNMALHVALGKQMVLDKWQNCPCEWDVFQVWKKKVLFLKKIILKNNFFETYFL